MSRISGRDTKPEIEVRKFLFGNGYRFRINKKELPGKPDIVLPKYKTVIFVNGCFWHGHTNCEKASLPKSNSEFWENKISKNVVRDNRNCRELKKLGWRVVVIWQCEIGSKVRLEKTFKKLLKRLNPF